MARAAVKAKQAARAGCEAAAKRPQKRRGHAGGGNPNQQLFFVRMRRSAKPVYVILAVLFAITFAFLGVGSGPNGPRPALPGPEHLPPRRQRGGEGGEGDHEEPEDPKGYRDLATAYESKGENASAISALQQYTAIKKKDAAAWNELAGLQVTQAQTYLTQYQAASQDKDLAAPSASFLPSGKLGKALGTNTVEQVQANGVNGVVTNLQQQTQLAFNGAVTSYNEVTKLQPTNANAWIELAQTAQQSGDYTTALRGYKQYLKLNPDSSSKAQIQQLIKQLSPAVAPAPSKKKK